MKYLVVELHNIKKSAFAIAVKIMEIRYFLKIVQPYPVYN